LHLRLLGARFGLVARAVFGVAVEPILDEHAEREEQDRRRVQSPVAAKLHPPREPEHEEEDRDVEQEIAHRAHGRRLVAAQECGARDGHVTGDLQAYDQEQKKEMCRGTVFHNWSGLLKISLNNEFHSNDDNSMITIQQRRFCSIA
jgi:hypothetical protein